MSVQSRNEGDVINLHDINEALMNETDCKKNGRKEPSVDAHEGSV